MIFRFDEADLKQLADVIEAERRVRERLYYELKWNNDWSPSPASRITRIRRKVRPQSGKERGERESEATSDDEPPKGYRRRAKSSREESKTSRLKSFAIQIGDKSKNLALAWGENPSCFSVGLQDGTSVERNHRHCCKHGVGSLTINTKSGGRSFQIENSTTMYGGSNVVIKSNDEENGRGNRRHNASSFHIENSTSPSGTSNVVIKTTDADVREKTPRQRQRQDSSTDESRQKRSYRSRDKYKDKRKYSSTEEDSPSELHRRRPIKYKQKRKESSPEAESDKNSSRKGKSKSKRDTSDDEKQTQKRKSRQKKKSESSAETDDFFDNEDTHRHSEEERKSTLEDVDDESEELVQAKTATANDMSTQTTWMDTVADGPPAKVAEEEENPEYRKLKYFGEKRTHKVCKPAVADDYQLRTEAREDFPLVLEVTRPQPKKPSQTDHDREVDTEVIHYIDKCAVRPEYEVFEPVFVQPHSMWKPKPRMKVEEFQPLELYQYRKPGSRERYLVIANPKPERNPEPRGPIRYKKRIEHNRCW